MRPDARARRVVVVLYAVALLVTLRLPGAANGHFGLADVPVVLAVAAFVVWLERARHRRAAAAEDTDADRARERDRRGKERVS